jgi:hypothetical protein
MSRHPKSGQNQNIRTANESFENMAKLKYLGTTLTNHNDSHNEIKSILLREEHRLRVSENRVLRRIFGPKREEDGSWKKLHNDNFIACVLRRILLG